MKFTLVCGLLVLVQSALCQRHVDNQLINSNVERKIDLSSHLVRITDVITVENTGKNEARNYVYAVPDPLADSVSFAGATTKVGDEEVDLTMSELDDKAKKLYSVELNQPLAGGKTVTVTVTVVCPHSLKPYPSEVTQGDKQLVLFTSNLLFYSPYTTKSQTSKVTLASAKVEHYTELKPVTKTDNTITYGPYADKEPYSERELKIHYENNSPFLAITRMHRLIEVSHWGNVAVEETIDIRHTGAVLTGAFSRADYQRSKEGNSVKAFKTVLPASAKNVYYRDEIGNISTSHMRQTADSIEIELRPRFPLFGGWKTHYVIGYNIPSWQYLYNKGESYVLKMPFIDHVYDDQVVDDLTVEVILPEGCRNIKLKTPYGVNRQKDRLTFTYLDISGRPVITTQKSRLVEQHIQDFQLSYKFTRMLLVREPLITVTALFLLFLAIIVYVRLDFTITRDENKEARMKVASLIDNLRSLFDERVAKHDEYNEAIESFKASKSKDAFAMARKNLDAELKKLGDKLADMQRDIKAIVADLGEKVAEGLRLEGQALECTRTMAQAAEKLVLNRMDKKAYLEARGNAVQKHDDHMKKAEATINSL